MIDPQEYLPAVEQIRRRERMAHIFEIYRKELLKANALDFDDLLLETVRLLKSSSEVRERYKRRYQYILIDEYQDTNRPQYELMKLLAGEHHNVCVVGDEDQSNLSLARRGHPQHSRVREGFSRSEDHPAGAELSLDAGDSRSGVGGGREQRQRKGKNLWTDRAGRLA